MGSIREFRKAHVTTGIFVDAPMTLSALESALHRAKHRWVQQHPDHPRSVPLPSDAIIVVPSETGVAFSWTDVEEEA